MRDAKIVFLTSKSTTSTPVIFIWEFPPPPGITVDVIWRTETLAVSFFQDAKTAKEEKQREKTEDLKEMMLQEIRRRPPKNEKELIEQERNRRAELYQKQMNDRRGSTDILLEVQEQLLKIFSKLKVWKKSVYLSSHLN